MKCNLCFQIPDSLFIRLPNNYYAEPSKESAQEQAKYDKIEEQFKNLIYIQSMNAYQCPECSTLFKKETEYSEDGPFNCSSEKWFTYTKFSQGEGFK